MRAQYVEECQSDDIKKTNGNGLQLAAAKARQGYKRSSSALPESHSNRPHPSDETHKGVKSSCYKGFYAVRSPRIAFFCPDIFLWEIEKSFAEEDDALTPLMRETSSSRERHKDHQHNGKVKHCQPLEEMVSSGAMDVMAPSALSHGSASSKDDKAGRHLSVTLAPPTWNSEDEGVATSCKRIKVDLANSTEHTHSAALKSNAGTTFVSVGDIIVSSQARILGSKPVVLDVDGDARERTASSGLQNAPKQKASNWEFLERYKRSGSSSFPDYRLPSSSASSIITERNGMAAGERRTSGVPGGSFRPHNTLQHKPSSSSSLPRPNPKKIFNLQDGEFVTSGEHRAAKRQKLDSEQTVRTDSSSSVMESEIQSRLNMAKSTSSKGSASKQFTGSRTNNEPATLFDLGEYRKVEATVSWDPSYNSSRPSKAGVSRRRPSGEGRSSRQVNVMRESGNSDLIEDVAEREVTGLKSEAKRYRSTAKRSISRPDILWEDFEVPNSPDQISLDSAKSPYFGKQNKPISANEVVAQPRTSNINSKSPLLNTTGAPKRQLSYPDMLNNAVEEVQFLEDDSVDLVKTEGVLPTVEQDLDLNTTSHDGSGSDLVIPKSKSISNDGDIPRSNLAKVQHKVSRKQTRRHSKQEISFNIIYIHADEAFFELQDDCEPWQFQYDHEKREFDVCGSGDSMTSRSPSLILKPDKIQNILYSDDSAKVVVHRSRDYGSSPTLLVQTQSTEDGARLAQCLKRLNEMVKLDDTPNARLNSVFENAKKVYNSSRIRMKSQNSEDISLLEANEARRAASLKPLTAVRIASETTKQKQPANTRRKHGVIIDKETHKAQPRRQTLAKAMTTISSQGDQTSSHASEAKLRDFENPNMARIGKNEESVDGFRPITRASARQESNDRQFEIRKSRSPSPVRWTKQNSKWQDEKHWRTSLLYPAEGKSRTTVDARDIERLDEGEFLNDNIIGFYLRFLEVQVHKFHPEISRRIYFQNTYFYGSLTKGKIRSNNINYDAVRNWTSKVDIFSYDYIIVPVCEKFHWYVAIICNAPKLLHIGSEEGQGLQKAEDLSILNMIHEPTADLDDARHKASLSMDAPENGQSISIFEQPQNPTSRVSASPSVTAQVEQMSLDDNEDWPEPDALPQQPQSKFALATEDLMSKDNLREEVKSVEIPQKSKKPKRKSLPPPRKYDPREPRIITLDSLGGAHSPTCSNLRAYLVCEAKERKAVDISPGPLGMTATGLPQQGNYCDCGVFILGYVQKFLEDPDEFVRGILQRDADQVRHWPEMNAAKMRGKIRKIIFQLHDEQTQQESEQREAKSKVRKSSIKVESKRSALHMPPGDKAALQITQKAVPRSDTHETNQQEFHKAPSRSADVGDRESVWRYTPEVEISLLAPLVGQHSSISLRDQPASKSWTNKRHFNRGISATAKDTKTSEDVEIIEKPTGNYRNSMEPPKRRLYSAESSPLRSSVRRRISTVNLESPVKATKSKNPEIEQPACMIEERTAKSSIFKEFARSPTSPSQNALRKTSTSLSSGQWLAAIEDLKDYKPGVGQTPIRALERTESFEDILEIEDSDSSTVPPTRSKKASISLVNSPPTTPIRSTPRNLRSSSRNPDALLTSSESPGQRREARRFVQS